jgi:hypothetical protein
MIILGLLLEVMDLSGADLDNVTRPRLPSNPVKPAGGARRPGKRPTTSWPSRDARAAWRGGNMMTSDHRQVSITVLDDEESARERRLRMGGLHDRQSPAHGSLSKKR